MVAACLAVIAFPSGASAATDVDLADGPHARLKVPGLAEVTAIPAGDVNGDGEQDIAYADLTDSTLGRELNGSVRVVLGPIRNSASAAAEPGFTIHGFRSFGCIGRELASGDVNGDGLSDLVIGSAAGCDAWDKHGGTVVVFGSTRAADVDTAATGPWGYRIDGTGDTAFAGSEPQFGNAVAVSPDMNGDGRDEVVATSFAANGDGPEPWASAGAAYVFWGKSDSARQTVDDAAIRVHGQHNSANLGSAAAAVGDVNDDGVPDVAFSTPWVRDSSGKSRGELVVLYGTSERRTLDDTAMGDAGFTVSGAPGDYLGLYPNSLEGVGDQNGDGRDDLLVGTVYSGRSYVIYSPAAGGHVDLSSPYAPAYRLSGGSGYGYVVGALGDQDGDRVPELATTDYAASTLGRERNGVLYVIPGANRDLDVAASSEAAFTIHGAFDGDTVTQVTSFPDVDRDGRAELLLSRSYGTRDSYIDIVSLRGGRPPIIDVTPPEVRCEVAAEVWHSVNVAIECTAHDRESGLVLATDARFELRTNVPLGVETADALTDSRRVCDRAGNCVTAGPVAGNRVDRRGPTVELTCPSSPVLLTAAVNATIAASDGGTGLAVDPSGPLALDTGALGIRSVSATATDRVGNSGSGECAYVVVRDLGLPVGGRPDPVGGLPDPVVELPPLVAVRAGQQKTFSFPLANNKGQSGMKSAYPTERKVACDTLRPSGKRRRLDAPLRYRAKKRTYSFTWRTKRKMRGSCRELTVRRGKTTLHRIWVALR